MLLGTLPPGAHLAASDDNILFVLIYLQLVESLRPDVDLILQAWRELPPLRFDPDREPLFFTTTRTGATRRSKWSGRLPTASRAPAPRAALLLRPAGRGRGNPRVPKDYLRQPDRRVPLHVGVTHETRDRRAPWPSWSARGGRSGQDVCSTTSSRLRRHGAAERALAAFERSAAINRPRFPAPPRARRERIEELRAASGSAA